MAPDDLSVCGHHLVLGGCGFIGRHVALKLARLGNRVIIADRHSPAFSFPEDVQARISFIRFDMADAAWPVLIEGAAVIHHYAWSTYPSAAHADPLGDLRDNALATIALLEAIRAAMLKPRLIFASSGGTVYGRLEHVPVREEHPLAPITAYGAGKAAMELYMGVYRAIHGIDCRIARMANPFGAGQDLARGQGAATTFLHHALTGQPIVIWGDGEAVRDYIHISDVAAGLAAIACKPGFSAHATFNIGSGHGVSLNGIVAELERRLGRTLDVQRQPGRSYDVPVSILDVTLARNELDWAAKLSFSDGMSRTLNDLSACAELSTCD